MPDKPPFVPDNATPRTVLLSSWDRAVVVATHRGRAPGTLREQVMAERDRAEAARAELAEWTAGGPVARAVRAFLDRRGRG